MYNVRIFEQERTIVNRKRPLSYIDNKIEWLESELDKDLGAMMD
jgi:hypothetical protein